MKIITDIIVVSGEEKQNLTQEPKPKTFLETYEEYCNKPAPLKDYHSLQEFLPIGIQCEGNETLDMESTCYTMEVNGNTIDGVYAVEYFPDEQIYLCIINNVNLPNPYRVKNEKVNITCEVNRSLTM